MHSLIVLAAGSGSRMNLGYNKMLHKIDGEPIINHTLKKFVKFPEFSQIIVVINPDDEAIIKELIIDDPRIEITYGEGERQDSVARGVKLANGKYTFVHDGARIYITDDLITRMLETVNSDQDAYVCAVKVKDSIRKVQSNIIVEALNRDELYAMQTPQIVKTEILKRVELLAKADGILETDEVGLLNHYKYQVSIIEGEYANKKVTTIEDL